MWEYRARCVNIVDGDTIDVVVDLGFQITREIRLRLAGVDTHETYGVEHGSEEYRRGMEETAFVKAWIETAREDSEDWPLVVSTNKTGKFGRYLATVTRTSDEEVLNKRLLNEFDGVTA